MKKLLNFKSLKTRILTMVILTMLILLGILSTSVYLTAKNAVTPELNNLITEVVNARANEMELFLQGRIQDLKYLAINPNIQSLDHETSIEELKKFLNQRSDIYEMMFIAEKDGTAPTTADSTANISTRDYFQELVIKRTVEFTVSNPVISLASGKQIFVIAHAIKDKNNQVIGIVGATVELQNMSNMINNVRIGQKGSASLIDGNGIVLYDENHDQIMNFNLLKSDKEGYKNLDVIGRNMLSGKSDSEIYISPTGERILTFYSPLKNSPNWSLTLNIPLNQFNSVSDHLLKIILILIVIIIVVMFIVMFVIGNIISNPIKELSKIIQKITNKDLSKEENRKIDNYIERRDEIGLISNSLLTMKKNYNDIISNFGKSTDVIFVSSDELNKISDQNTSAVKTALDKIEEINNNIQNTSASAQEITSGVEEVAASAQSVSKSAQELADYSNQALDSSQKGQKNISEIFKSIKDAGNQSKETSSIVRVVEQKSQNIGQIVEKINTIAEQTNLLALNAAIEAARAGEAGKGFAVVADEIRKLAEDSKKTTAEIDNILKEIKSGVESADKATDKTVKIVEEISSKADTVELEFKEIIQKINFMNSMIENLTATSEEQSASAEEISGAMDTVTKAIFHIEEDTQMIMKGAKISEGFSISLENKGKDLQRISTDLEQQVKEFKL
jgi:methyl-accepting chemotaxis protein